MQEEKRSRVQTQRRKQQQQTKLLVLILVVALLGGCAVLALQDGGKQQSPEGVAAGQVQPQTGAGQAQDAPQVALPVAAEEDNWKAVLVNSSHALADGYVPELVTVDHTDFKFDARAAADLNAMLQGARDAGLSPMICSSYRSWERQTQLFEKQVVKQQNTGLSYEEAYEKAKTVVAYPGTSEHQTGLAADIVATSHQMLDDSQADTAEQQWLMANCWQYGFVLRYPAGKSDLTGVIYEPWHYRYVGKELAQYIMENGLCLEEYWQQLEAAAAEQ